MDFRTAIHTAENVGLLSHNQKLMMLGSCFSDNIGNRLAAAMMNVVINPFGTIYNPMSIAASVSRIIENRPIAGMDLFQQNGVWNSYAFHSRYSMSDKEATLARMNRSIEQAHSHLSQCSALIITLGTAVTYTLRATGEVVSNCHKVPQHEFSRGMADVDEITRVLQGMVDALLRFNPQLVVIFTVSPIRHIADGLETNSLSKATLRLSTERMVKAYPGKAFYFPAYEIMMDDLRDYRFYAPDMVHPSDVAIEYIWQVFQSTYFDDFSSQAIARCERVRKRLNHRPMSASREAVERFQSDTRTVVRNLLKEYPYLAEMAEIKEYIN
ncbi:MAG: GSCFA domain-containing protein [Muribaculaceae bacterium]|nr:GSCFA domain-containing protein [Muribaculaceae bacterium]